MLTLLWYDGKYRLNYNIEGSGPAGDLYTPELLEEVLSVCGMRQFYLPPRGGQVAPPNGQTELPGGQVEVSGGEQGDHNVTCPALPADPYDCTIPSHLRYKTMWPEAKVKCPGLQKIINDGLKTMEKKRGGKTLTLTDQFKTSHDVELCDSP